jgi:prepilin-type N-terminal cleavage/methylation domain-containing protein
VKERWQDRQEIHRPRDQRSSGTRGFTLLEVIFVCLIAGIMSVIALPLITNVMGTYRLRAAVASVTGAIQTTRYQAISSGYPYQVIFNKAASTYQVQSNQNPTTSTTFSNVGGTVPLSGSGFPVVLGVDTTLQFKPGGTVFATTGSTTLTLTHSGNTETIQVTSYGSVKVTP